MKKAAKKHISKLLLSGLLVVVVLIFQWFNQPPHAVSVEDVPPYSDHLYAVIDQNTPNFREEDLVREAYEFYKENGNGTKN